MIRNTLAALMFVCSFLITNRGLAQDQAAKDDKELKEYFAKNKINATRTASGLYYSITRKGKGEKPKAGQVVTMSYNGKFLNGSVFDGDVDENYQKVPERDPIFFRVGIGHVIKGWDEGLMLMHQGDRATLYVPSGLGYGPTGKGPVPGNSILVFKVELVDIKDAK